MVKTSDQIKTYILDQKEKTHITLRNWVTFKNVPYADYFNAEEALAVVSIPKQPIDPSQPFKHDVPSYRSVYRNSSTMIFHKKVPLFQSKIEKGAVEKGIEGF